MSTHFVRLAVCIVSLLAGNAYAGLVGVKTIEIKNAIGTYLQVSAAEALNQSFIDMALAARGGSASAPDNWPGLVAANAIDGNFGTMFHEGADNSNDTLTITLAAPQDLFAFQVWGRSDCCSDRDIYDVVFKDASGATLYAIDDFDARNDLHVASFSFGQAPFPNQGDLPEPSTLALLGSAFAALLALVRRQRADFGPRPKVAVAASR